MVIWSNLVLTGLLEILLIQRCYSRWNFYNRYGHRIRHNRYWKLNDYPQGVRCHPLSNIQNGQVTVGPSYLPGGVASYKCNVGYILKGPKRRDCLATGEWSLSAPKCLSQGSCGQPPDIVMATHDADPNQKTFPSASTVRYRCQEGFYFRGGYVQAECTGGDHWDLKNMKCRPISCGHPGSLPNGRRIGFKFFYKEKVVFLCDEGYKVTCSKQALNMETDCQVRMCQANGRWSGSQPICKPIRCPRLRAPQNGRVSGMWTKVNSILTFSCNPGYYLVGSRTRRCQRDGIWDGGNATCKIWNCGLPPFVPHARLNYTDTIFGSKATYRCVPNSSFSGESEILECGPDGIWKPDPPKCLSHCPVLKVINGTISVDNVTRNGDVSQKVTMVPHALTVNVKCKGGYQLRTPVFPRCQNGSWSIIPKCEPAPCLSRPPIGINAQARFYSLKHGAKAYYACYLGYNRSSGQDVLKCQFGTWIGTAPVCQKTSCPKPTVPENGKIFLVGANGRWAYKSQSMLPVHDDLIEYQCLPGYRIKGQQNAVCINGEWRPPEIPECETIRHKRLPIEWVLYKPRRHYMTHRRT